jgi:mono/diheme cytochrome c family protein
MYPSVSMKHLPLCLLTVAVLAACSAPPSSPGTFANAPGPATGAVGLQVGGPTEAQVLQGRQLVINQDCGACHGGMPNPAAEGWLAGKSGDDEAELLGPFRVWANNLTPHDETGLGRVSERQIFNALRYGLRPGATPDVEITSMVPGEGNHPSNPNYLSPAMPWVNWRFMSDDELWAIAAYLKHGVRPVAHRIPQSEAPPDFWASEYTVEKIGTHILPPFPTQHEELRDPQRREQVLRGRGLVASSGCVGCHGGAVQPYQDGWLTGSRPGLHPTDVFQIGPFKTYPRNLTPDNVTGLGRFSERQIFNSLRYGLRPGETADVVITSTTPGVGNHPASPKYLAVPMPWPAWRHMSDDELWAIAAYLKNGVRPVRNLVTDSEGPPDFWASEYTPDKIGTFPPAPFPTAKERAVVTGARR